MNCNSNLTGLRKKAEKILNERADKCPDFADMDSHDKQECKQAKSALDLKDHNIIEYSSSIIATCDLEGNMINGNPSFLKAWGFDSPEEFIDRPFWDFWLVKDRIDEIMRALRRDGTWFGEAEAKRNDGKIFDVQVSAATVFDTRGCPIALTSTSIDITELKQAEEALRRLNETLEQQVSERTAVAEDRAKQLQTLVGELTLAEQRERGRIAKVLHDNLQQLLVGAKINSEVLSSQIEQKHKGLAENILGLINQSIQTSRSLTAELSPPVLQQGLSAVLNWICRQMQQNHGLTVELKTDYRLDPRREDITVLLYQSVRELLLNIVKHAGVKLARIEMSDGQEQLRLIVSDDGSGFDPAAVQEMKNTGYGLISIRERLDMIGGNFRIESSPGKGASFTLIVPLESREEKDEKYIRKIMNNFRKAKTPGERIRVLLVDDHTVVRQGLSTMLNLHSDIDIIDEAADGEEAVEKSRELQPDVILMDITMPKMDGIEATRIISSEFPHMRIIGLSMHDKKDQAERMIEAGASAYCTKGGDSNLLLTAIREGGGEK